VNRPALAGHDAPHPVGHIDDHVPDLQLHPINGSGAVPSPPQPAVGYAPELSV
jgi:hypothetical protein